MSEQGHNPFASDYEVGRLYKARTKDTRGQDEETLIATDRRVTGYPWNRLNGQNVLAGDVIDVRGPLVVLDLTDVDGTQFDPARLAGLLTAAQAAAQTAKEARMVRSLRDQIIEQTEPSKPAEPKGLGAVVKDRAARIWVRVDSSNLPWCSRRAIWRSYSDIDVPDESHILAEGIEGVKT